MIHNVQANQFQVKAVCFVLHCPLSCQPIPATSCGFKHSVAWWPVSLPRIIDSAGVAMASSSLSCNSTGSSDPKAQQIETKSASLDRSNRGQNQQAQVCIPLRTAVSVGFSDDKTASILQQQHSHQQEGALKMTASASVQQPTADQQ